MRSFIHSLTHPPTQPPTHSLNNSTTHSLDCLTHSLTSGLVDPFIVSVIDSFIGSSFGSLIDSLIGSLVAALFFHSLSHSCTDSVMSLISCHFIGISATICSFVDSSHSLNLWLRLHLTGILFGHCFLIYFETSAPARPGIIWYQMILSLVTHLPPQRKLLKKPSQQINW